MFWSSQFSAPPLLKDILKFRQMCVLADWILKRLQESSAKNFTYQDGWPLFSKGLAFQVFCVVKKDGIRPIDGKICYH